MTRDNAGFTILEVLVAVLVLTVGVTSLVGSGALVTRMIGQGKRTTQAAQYAERRLEMLRQQSLSSTPQCGTLAGGTATQSGGITETWTVTTSGVSRILRAIVRYPTGKGYSTDTLTTYIRCS